MKKYIDADKLVKFKEALADIIVSSQGICTYQDCKDIAEREALLLIASLQQEQPQVADASKMEPEGIEAVVHHCAGVHYLATNTEQLNARLKQFDEGAKVLVYIEARKEE